MACVRYRTAKAYTRATSAGSSRTSAVSSSASSTHVCGGCGQLKCLCRPRFFAGQLLSEEDLNRLDRYLVEKSRLHNRQLHGWGVVNGLEVRCHPCDDLVTVSCGYALSPCGDDIVVCEDDTVDICALIKECREKEREELECKPYQKQAGCAGMEEVWVLAIRYDERATRGITPLRGNQSCCENSKNAKKARDAPAQCEPTVTCEEYRYEVFRAPDDDPAADDQAFQLGGAMVERLNTCVKSLFSAIPTVPDQNASNNDWYTWCCRVKQSLAKYLERRPGHSCQLRKRLACVVCPDPNSITFLQDLASALVELYIILVELLFDCLCSALMPPCPAPEADNRVPLATVRVQAEDCTIIRVCNWTTLRKYATTFTNLQYWLSWLPFGRMIREYLERLCCELAGLDSLFDLDSTTGAVPSASEVPGAVAFTEEPLTAAFDTSAEPTVDFESFTAWSPAFIRSQQLTEMIMSAAKRSGKPVRPSELVGSFLGRSVTGDEPPMTEVERANIPQYMLLNQVAAPLVRSLVRDKLTLASVIGRLAGAPSTATAPAADEVTELRRQVAKLEQEMVKLRTELRGEGE
jgi:hypothetical protein